MQNSESDIKDAITRFQQEQRQAALQWEKEHKKTLNPKGSPEYSNLCFTRHHDRFDYFK